MKTRKRNDTSGSPIFTCADEDGPVDLTNAASVAFIMRFVRGAVKVNGACVVDPDQVTNKGKCAYTWQAADVNTSGLFQIELQVTWGDGTKTTYPSDRYEQLTIIDDLDNA